MKSNYNAMKSRPMLESFVAHCQAHPEERFWQALRNWSGWGFIFVSNETSYSAEFSVATRAKLIDTFYWEDKQKPDGG